MKNALPGQDEIRRCLASTALFRGLDDAVLRSLERELELTTLEAGAILLRQSEVGDCLYVLLSGRLRTSVTRESGGEVVVGEISPGEIAGEMAIVADEPRSATVVAVRPSVLVRLTRAGFERLEHRHPMIMKHTAQLLARRLRQVNAAGERSKAPLTIGVMSGAPGAPLSLVARSLSEALGRLDTTCHVDAEAVNAQHGIGSARRPADSGAGIRLTAWLSEQERRHRFVVYEAEEEASAWTRRVARQSDRILAVVAPGGAPPAEAAAFFAVGGAAESTARKELVLLHSGGSRTITGTAAWLDAFHPAEHHHVSPIAPQDFARVARIIAGEAVGLVLGGGGARGFAHIGAIRALREAGVPIDSVGGTGMGALIAAQCAMDWDVAQMLEVNREAFRRHPLHGSYTSPVISHMPHRALRLFEIMFGEHRIEDQWRSFFSVACNLTRGEAVVSRSGRFRDAVEASNALPVLNAPIMEDGDLIVDGALVNNLPADVMRERSGGRVIAVDVSPPRNLRTSGSDPGGSGWEASRVFRSGRHSIAGTPTLQGIVMRTVMLNSALSADSMQRYIDVYVKPPLDTIEVFDWAAIDAAAEIGYRAAAKQFESLRCHK